MNGQNVFEGTLVAICILVFMTLVYKGCENGEIRRHEFSLKKLEKGCDK